MGGVVLAAIDDAEIEAGIEEVEVELEQEQEDIDQDNEAAQYGAAYATADYAGDVSVEQSGELTAGTIVYDPVTLATSAIGDGIDASSEADAEADLEQVADQDNVNSQQILDADADPLTPSLTFTADGTFTDSCDLLLRSATPRSAPGLRTSRLSSSRNRRRSSRRTRPSRLALPMPLPMQATWMWSRAAC